VDDGVVGVGASVGECGTDDISTKRLGMVPPMTVRRSGPTTSSATPLPRAPLAWSVSSAKTLVVLLVSLERASLAERVLSKKSKRPDCARERESETVSTRYHQNTRRIMPTTRDVSLV